MEISKEDIAKMKQKATPKKKASKKMSFGSMKDSMVQVAKKDLGESNALTTSEFNDLIFGIDITSILPLQYVFGVDVVPLEGAMTLVGEAATTKSGTALGVFGRQFMGQEGIVAIIETESKVSPDYYAKLIHDKEWYNDMFYYFKAKSVNAIFSRIKYFLKWHAKTCPKIPVLLIVDSIGMVYTEEILEKMKKTGDADKTAGMRNAGAVNAYMRQMIAEDLPGSLASVLFINHQALDCAASMSGPFAPKAKTEVGGATKEFAWPIKIETSKGPAAPKGKPWKNFVYKVTKNSFGKTYKTRLIVPREETIIDGEPALVYDWDTALINLIMDDTGMEHSKAELNKIVDITNDGSVSKYKSKILNVRDLTAKEMGKLIHSNPDLVKRIQDFWGIKRKRKVQGEL